MIVQERDRKILQYVYEHQFLLADQVSEIFFGKRRSSEAYRRVRELEKEGFVRRDRLAAWNNVRAIRVTAEGAAVVRQTSLIEVPQLKRLDLATLAHDVAVIETRVAILKYWDATWIPEGAFRADSKSHELIPDGVAVFATGFKFAIEVENSLKNKERYLDLFRSYRDQKSYNLVLYVTTTPEIHKRLTSHIQEARADNVGMVLHDELKAGPAQAWSIGGHRAIFSKRVLG